MLKIMIACINRLIIPIASGKAIDCPPEDLRNKKTVAMRKHGEISGLNFHFDRGRVSRDYWWSHFRLEYQPSVENARTFVPQPMLIWLYPPRRHLRFRT